MWSTGSAGIKTHIITPMLLVLGGMVAFSNHQTQTALPLEKFSSDFQSFENIKSDRNEEDLLYEILLKYGLDLTLPINKPFENKNIYNIGFGALIICLDNNVSIDITDEIIAIKKEYDSEITRVVFKDSGFKNATEKTNIIKTLNQNGIDEVVSVWDENNKYQNRKF